MLSKQHYLFLGVLVVILLVFGFFFMRGGFPPVKSGAWQAVFLNNNQVYFGHIKNLTSDYIVLTDIFYLRAVQPLQQGAEAAAPLSLVKLGNEIHGPEDAMYVPKSNVLFWENMKEDSQVTRAITQFLQANAK